MNEFERFSRIANEVKAEFPEGTRILLIEMGDDPRPILPNTRGTVQFVDDMATLFCKFDNGRNLGLAYGADSYRKLTEQEIAEEKRTNIGYEIIKSCTIGNNEIVIGHNPKAVEPYVCWYCKNSTDYYWGYYCKSITEARDKMAERYETERNMPYNQLKKTHKQRDFRER